MVVCTAKKKKANECSKFHFIHLLKYLAEASDTKHHQIQGTGPQFAH
jgi:hypothetical protein